MSHSRNPQNTPQQPQSPQPQHQWSPQHQPPHNTHHQQPAQNYDHQQWAPARTHLPTELAATRSSPMARRRRNGRSRC